MKKNIGENLKKLNKTDKQYVPMIILWIAIIEKEKYDK